MKKRMEQKNLCTPQLCPFCKNGSKFCWTLNPKTLSPKPPPIFYLLDRLVKVFWIHKFSSSKLLSCSTPHPPHPNHKLLKNQIVCKSIKLWPIINSQLQQGWLPCIPLMANYNLRACVCFPDVQCLATNCEMTQVQEMCWNHKTLNPKLHETLNPKLHTEKKYYSVFKGHSTSYPAQISKDRCQFQSLS
jgi:hypothetical protein